MRFIAFEVSAGQFIAWLWPGMLTNIARPGTGNTLKRVGGDNAIHRIWGVSRAMNCPARGG